MDVPDEVSAYVEQLAHGIITPEGRAGGGFDPPLETVPDAGPLERLLAFTGRNPS